jgi:hypothetical protein
MGRGTSAPTCRHPRGSAAGSGAAVRHQGSRCRGDGGTGVPGCRAGAGADDGGVAGVAGVAVCLDQPQLCRARPGLPGPVPGRDPAGGFVGRRRAGDVHRDRPRRDGARPPGQRVVQDQLGHSTIVLTADTYAGVLPEMARRAADHTAAFLFPLRNASATRSRPKARRGRGVLTPSWDRVRLSRRRSG